MESTLSRYFHAWKDPNTEDFSDSDFPGAFVAKDSRIDRYGFVSSSRYGIGKILFVYWGEREMLFLDFCSENRF